MKTFFEIASLWLLLAALMGLTSCAHTAGEVEIAARGIRYFQCAPKLDAATCHLVRSAAFWSTQRGYPTVESAEEPGLMFMPPPDGVRTVFLRGMVVMAQNVGRVPALEQHGIEVWVRARPDSVEFRASELVSLIEDRLFVEGR